MKHPWINYRENKKEFIELVADSQSKQKKLEVKNLKRKLTESKKRTLELDDIICNLYEDKISGLVN